MGNQQYQCLQRHALLLRDDSRIIDDHHSCGICGYWVTAPYYVCNLCKYHAHKSCEELPKQINLSFHPRHPLTLCQSFTNCHSCNKTSENALMFKCYQCNFYLDVKCTLMSNSTTASPKGKEDCSIQHSSHPHLLLLVDDSKINKDVKIECFACKSNSSPSAGVYYGCKRCKYYLHKKCIDQLPQEIQHPNHPHLLSPRARLFDSRCSFCEKKEGRTLYFECTECDFISCVQCCENKIRMPFHREYHEHPLCFVEKTYTKLGQCNAHDCYHKLSVISNSNEIFDVAASSIFRCLDCDFKLHLLCAPLPSTIKHKCHLHPLILVDYSLIEDDFGEYYCDVCETSRNPRIRVYCCDQCKYIAHVHCVIPEIINVLKDDIKDVKLKSVGEDIWKVPREIDNEGVQLKEQDGSFLTLRDLIPKLTEAELIVLRRHFYWDEDINREEVSQRTTQLEPGDETIDEVLQLSSFTESRFNSFFKNDFDFGYYQRKLKISSSDLTLKIVNVEGHWIPFTLASALKHLLHKYGDISGKSSRSPAMKSIIYFFLCQVLNKIHTTLVMDITKDLLRDWYYYLRFTERSTFFDVSFLKASLEEITTAYFYLQVSKLDVEVPTILQNKIAEYKTEIANYEAKIAKCKAKLETCTNLRESSLQQEFMKKGLKKLMKLKSKTAGEVHF